MYIYMCIYTGLWFVIHQIELVFRCLRLSVDGGENMCSGRGEGELGMVGCNGLVVVYSNNVCFGCLGHVTIV